jgi:hypothetical protein
LIEREHEKEMMKHLWTNIYFPMLRLFACVT